MNVDIEIEIPIKKRCYEKKWAIDHLSRLSIQLPDIRAVDVLLAILSEVHPAESPICIEADEAWIGERRVARATGRRLVQRENVWALREVKDDEFVSFGGIAYVFTAGDAKELGLPISKVRVREWYGTFALSNEFVPFLVRYDSMISHLQMEQFILENMGDEIVFFYSPNHRHVEIMARDIRNLLGQIRDSINPLCQDA
jgi:hypothetical protein